VLSKLLDLETIEKRRCKDMAVLTGATVIEHGDTFGRCDARWYSKSVTVSEDVHWTVLAFEMILKNDVICFVNPFSPRRIMKLKVARTFENIRLQCRVIKVEWNIKKSRK
jgi:hypothetical protein